MTMEEKNQLIIDYINEVRKNLEENGYKVSEETVRNVTNMFIDSPKSFEEIKKEIDLLVEEKLEELRKRLELLGRMTTITDLDIDNLGITLNEQDIDLMMIANATTLNELQIALEKITNINVEIPNIEMDSEQFLKFRQQVFDTFMNSLTSRNDYYLNPDIKASKKIEYLRKSGIFSPEELQIFDSILQSGDINQILNNLSSTFSSDKLHQIFLIMKDYSPIEKTGIIGTDIETYQRMLQEIKSKYNSITIDEVAKYGNVALSDGTFDFRHLQKVLEFAKDTGKEVRLNTLIFYMDCPDSLYSLTNDEENRKKVKQELLSYVDQITSFIRDSGYEGTVRSIDVFNELLNRFAMDKDTPYMYRGEISQEQNVEDFDNIKSGWLKFLSVEDLCDIIAVAKKNLPNTDFMYNDDNLTDSRKIQATTEILKRIRQYESDHDIRLIDSIGTQMHIDNGVTKEQIISMFHSLGQYGLPIEITEFDMAMISDIDGLSDDEINNLRMKKMKEIFEAIDECRENDNIRGFTIWSKTDAQNFRVALENEQRIRMGKEPIETLYGGFYNNDMTEKKVKTKSKFQDFNYHTHTYRSGHSEYVSDEEFVKAAKRKGISMLGFSEHVPNTDLELPDEDHRMLISEVDDYIESISELKQENPDMTILAGFEAEFDPMKESFLGEMREKVDYMILGQHFVKNGMQMIHREGNPEYPLEYAKMVCQGMESGLFDIVAHPDCFMELRDTISDDDRAVYEENCIKASHMICQKAVEMGIPIEINMSKALRNKFLKDGYLGYPHPLFWQVASQYDVKVLKGIDAHFLRAFENLDKGQELITGIEEMVSDKMIKGPYNPVLARQSNPRLQEAYRLHQERALTYETHLVTQIINGIFARTSDGVDLEGLAAEVGTSLNEIRQRCIDGADKKDKTIVDEISTITDSHELSIKDKKSKLERKKRVINETNQVLANQQRVIENTKSNVINAMNIGCKRKDELSNVVTQLTQYQSTKSETQKSKIKQNLSSLQQSKVEQKAELHNIDKPKTLKKTSKTQSHSSSSSGFTNIITLALIASFVSGAFFMIVYMLINK